MRNSDTSVVSWGSSPPQNHTSERETKETRQQDAPQAKTNKTCKYFRATLSSVQRPRSCLLHNPQSTYAEARSGQYMDALGPWFQICQNCSRSRRPGVLAWRRTVGSWLESANDLGSNFGPWSERAAASWSSG